MGIDETGCARVCQQNKSLHSTPPCLLQPLPIPEQVWDDIAMDFIIGLPNSNGKSIIWVVIDRHSKYAHFSVLAPPLSASKVASALNRCHEMYFRSYSGDHPIQ